jgi:hypothetical protein
MEGKVNIQEGDLLDPTPELPDDTPVNRVQFPTRIHQALAAAGLKTVGRFGKPRVRCCLSCKISDPVRSPIFVKLLDCHRVMELGH